MNEFPERKNIIDKSFTTNFKLKGWQNSHQLRDLNLILKQCYSCQFSSQASISSSTWRQQIHKMLRPGKWLTHNRPHVRGSVHTVWWWEALSSLGGVTSGRSLGYWTHCSQRGLGCCDRSSLLTANSDRKAGPAHFPGSSLEQNLPCMCTHQAVGLSSEVRPMGLSDSIRYFVILNNTQEISTQKSLNMKIKYGFRVTSLYTLAPWLSPTGTGWKGKTSFYKAFFHSTEAFNVSSTHHHFAVYTLLFSDSWYSCENYV